jgi:hypothetical protein
MRAAGQPSPLPLKRASLGTGYVQVQYWQWVVSVPVIPGPGLDPERWGTDDGVLLVRYLSNSISRIYLDAVFFYVACFFCLVCSLFIIRLRVYIKLLQVRTMITAVRSFQWSVLKAGSNLS